jgi:hypothetical protein
MTVQKNKLGIVGICVFAILMIGACSGSSSNTKAEPTTNFADSGIGGQDAISPERVTQSVSIAYASMGQSIADFLNTPVDVSNPVASDSESANKIVRVRKDYDYFHLLISSLSTDEQLGTNGAPSLAQLQAVDEAISYWLQVRESYLGEISDCFPITDSYEYSYCQGPVFDRYETQLVDSAEIASGAIQAVDNSTK